jgi:coenzyme F420-reducing hydrogenase alpha subunit
MKKGNGVSAVEAPRGTLFHEYKIDKNGIIEYCNIITPTAQNLNMMEQDIILLVNQLLEKNTSKEQIVEQIEKLIRAYDPCFSCSTHFLNLIVFPCSKQ